MARCEECIHEKVCLHRANIQTDTYAYMGVKYDTKKCGHFKATADVVPKSEVDKTIAEWAWLHADTLNKLDKAKAEVAREIFAEIWSGIATRAFTSKSEDYADGAYDTIEWVDSKITEIEKKYVKGCRTCKHMLSCEPSVLGICDEYEEENKNGKENT